ncbi:DUF2591 domain-containing protein [Providencia stuartii]|uniref:phage protein NinX family protein n=1 Tax=Providencia stuartii TaxID=588 RepID=UPI0020209B28|nr:phage protein NinX family protein [Providencia stuartii]ELR5044023.1 DUF2591 domain-containing protein [Providencia rettgeri]URE77316.1 DUF2591 domain-containing protein [Providencia stuartii]
MNKYTELSDFEINKKVAECTLPSGDWHVIKRKKGNEIGCFITGRFDPCNNPSDAMPIIIEHKICMAYDVFAEEHDGGSWVAQPAYGFSNERVRSDNYYRAAMICFLMMKDAENEG